MTRVMAGYSSLHQTCNFSVRIVLFSFLAYSKREIEGIYERNQHEMQSSEEVACVRSELPSLGLFNGEKRNGPYEQVDGWKA